MAYLHGLFRLTYLLIITAILPLAFYYLHIEHPEAITEGLILAGIYGIFPFWLVVALSMGMYKFPISALKAGFFIAGYLFPVLLLSVLTDQTVPEMAYAVFLTSLVGTILVVLYRTIPAMISMKKPGYIAFMVFMGIFLFWFTYTIGQGYIAALAEELAPLAFWTTILTLTGSALMSGFGLIADEKESRERMTIRKKQWERWAGVTSFCVLCSVALSIYVAIFL